MSLSLLLAKVNTSAVSNILATSGTPLNLTSILLLEDLDFLAIDLNASFNFFNISIELTYKI